MDSEEEALAKAFAVIADDHVGMLVLIDRIETMLVEPEHDLDAIVAVLVDLTVAARDHFAYEDDLMGDRKLEEFERHRMDHRHLLTVLTDFTEAIRSGVRAPSIEVAFDLNNWLSFHIQRFDAELETLLTV